MNHGGAEIIRGSEVERSDASRRTKANDFGKAVSRVAVAQICEAVGFESFKESALDALADVAIRYIRDLGNAAIFHANLAGRTECNVFDIISGVEDFKEAPGFPGASGIGSCVAASGAVKEIIEYVGIAEEIPFAQPVPWFPVIRSRRPAPSFEQMGETPPGKHIPSWLPALPDPHTYIHTPVWNERKSDPRADKIEQARQRRKAERSLLNLQQRLAFSGSAGPSAPVASGDNMKEITAAARNNPFLADPLPHGEKEVSAVTLPTKLMDEDEDKYNVSLVEAFAPAIEALKSGSSEDGRIEKNVLPDRRPAVHFKLKTAKKFVGESLDLGLQKKGDGRTAPWFGREEEKDDKKRRAEYILRQSMENPQDLTQL